MTFFYDLNKRLANIEKASTLQEGAVAKKMPAKDLDEVSAAALGRAAEQDWRRSSQDDQKDRESLDFTKNASKEKTELPKAIGERSTGDYSAKKARAGKDIGKPGKQFGKIAADAAERYGSKERGEKVAGAVLAKLRKSHPSEAVEQAVAEGDMDESALQAYLGKKKYGEQGMKALQKAGREGAGKQKMDQLRNKFDKMDEALGDKHGNSYSIAKVKKFPDGTYAVSVQDEQNGNVHVKVGSAKYLKKLLKDRYNLLPSLSEGDMDEGNDFTQARLAAIKTKKPTFTVGGKTYKVTGDTQDEQAMEGIEDRLEKARQAHQKRTGREMDGDRPEADDKPKWLTTHKGKYGTEYQGDDEEGAAKPAGEKRGRGRPKGTGKRIGAKGPGLKSKLAYGEGMEDPTDAGEYDQEGDMAQEQLTTAKEAASELRSILDADENLPEWVQAKITKAVDYLDTARDYMKAKDHDETIAEKAVSKKQQRFMGMVHAAQKGEPAASAEVAKVAKEMPKKAAKEFAKTKHKGLPEKKSKEVDEAAQEAPKAKTSSKGFSFGKGIYDSYNREVEAMIAESISINMSMNNDGDNMTGTSQSLTVTATEEDAAKLAALLRMAGIGGATEATPAEPVDEAYGSTEPSENQPDWPTNTETSSDALQYSGGLNKPKITVAGDGQATGTVTAIREDQDLDEEKCNECGMYESKCKCDNKDLDESLARMRDLAGIKEAAKPDFPDVDKDGDEKETIKQALKDKEEKKMDESVFAMTNLWKAYKG